MKKEGATQSNYELNRSGLSVEDQESFRLACLYRMEYVAASCVGTSEEVVMAGKVFKDAVNNLSPKGRAALDTYFKTLPEADRPEKIGLEY